MNNRSIHRSLCAAFAILTAVPLCADYPINDNLVVSGTIGSTGRIDSAANEFLFGTQSGLDAVSLQYADDAMPGGTYDTLRFTLKRISASWLWSHGTSTPISAMRLDNAHQLVLYQADGTTAGLTFSPVSASIRLGTHASGTLTADANGVITVGGGFTVSGGITNTNGALTGGTNGLALTAGGTDKGITFSSSGEGDLIFNTNSLERVRINSAGNVGIGISSPATKLHLKQTFITGRETLFKGQVSDAGNDAFIIGNGTSANGTFAPTFAGYQATLNSKFSFGITGLVSAANDASSSYAGGIVRISGFRTDNPSDPTNGAYTNVVNRNIFSVGGLSDDGSQEYFIVGPTGKVGIGSGVSASSAKFTVQDSVFPVSRSIRTTTSGTAGISAIALQARASVNMTDGFGVFEAYEIVDNANVVNPIGSVGAVRDGADNSGSVAVLTYNAGVQSEKMRIKPNGNVGIGTTTPGSATKLQVNGRALFTGGLIDPGDASPPGVAVGYNSTYGFVDAIQTGVSARILALNASGGAVGVGTTSPGQRLSVAGTNGPATTSGTASDGALRVGSATTSVVLDSGVSGGSPVHSWVQSRHANSYATSFPLLLNPNGGNVGIGTTSPVTKLDVGGGSNYFLDAAIVTPLQVVGNGGNTGSYGGAYFITQSTDSGGGFLALGKARSLTTGDFAAVQSGDTLGNLAFVGADGSKLIRGASITSTAETNATGNTLSANLNFRVSKTNSYVEAMRITSDGNVGIGTGTGTLTHKLEVEGSVKAGGRARIELVRTIGGAAGDTVAIGSFSNDGIGKNIRVYLKGHNGSVIDVHTYEINEVAYIGAVSNWLELPLNQNSVSYTGFPAYTLDAYRPNIGSTADALFVRVRVKRPVSAGTVQMVLEYDDDSTFTPLTTVGSTAAAFNSSSNPAGGAVDGYYGAAEWAFPVTNGSGWGNAGGLGLFVKNSGNVGIGTSSPTHKLSVKGTIRAQEIIVDNTNWADYVFEDDYRLAPLAEVESHIKAKKHLPGIPSAAEVAEHGVSMGDMQAKLLSKVEELTLHLIAQEKRLAFQGARLDQLEEENQRLRTQLNHR